jgi:hypothetical protein
MYSHKKKLHGFKFGDRTAQAIGRFPIQRTRKLSCSQSPKLMLKMIFRQRKSFRLTTYEGRSENSRPEAEMSLYDHNSAILFKKEPSVGVLQSFRFARFIALLW